MKKTILFTLFVIIFLVALLAGFAYKRRDLPPVRMRNESNEAILAAKRDEAEKYAKDRIDKAERLYRVGLMITDSESSKLYFIRDYDVARSLFGAALREAEISAELTRGSREALKFNAQSRISSVRESIEGVEELRKTIRLDEMSVYRLRKAKNAVNEAEVFYKEGEYAKAVENSEKAIDLLQEVQEKAFDLGKRFMDWNHIQKWKKWIDDTLEHSIKKDSPVIIVDKLKHSLTLYRSGKKVRSYRADLGFNFINDKYYSGDNATPEGKYKIIKKKGKGQSIYYKALLLNYPNHEDWKRFDLAKSRGSISPIARIGGMIEIHGDGGRNNDWTEGCVALSNQDMDELFAAVGVGTPVTIVGSSDFDRDFAEMMKKNGKKK